MSTQSNKKDSPWIASPSIDLIFFSFGWLILFAAFIWVDQSSFRGQGRWVLLGLVLVLTVFHRHLTFPLVYGDREVLATRRKTFTWLPFFLIFMTIGSILYVRPPNFTTLQLSEPVKLSDKDSFRVYLRLGSKPGSTHKVQFDGTEQSVAQVAHRIRTDTKGDLLVKVDDGKLKFSLPPASKNGSFSFAMFRGPELRERLGFPTKMRLGWRETQPAFLFLLILSSLWNFYHTLMQKQGILRFYSRKAGYGKSWLDRSMVWLWFGWLFFALAASPFARNQASRLAPSAKFITQTLKPFFEILPYVAYSFLALALVFTILYAVEEWRHRDRIHWPKNFFVLSLWGIYLTFFYDFLVGFLVFAFSHAVEYLAFVNVYAKRKYQGRPVASSPMARFVNRQAFYFTAFMILSGVLFIPWYFESRATLNWYIVGTSFLHFLYDGWIWKVRRPEVGAPLGIHYPGRDLRPAKAQVA